MPNLELDTIRAAEQSMRADHGPEHERDLMWACLADWLRLAASDIWAFDYPDTDLDEPWAEHIRKALEVAVAYLAARAVTDVPLPPEEK